MNITVYLGANEGNAPFLKSIFLPLRSWMPDSLPFSAAMQGMEGCMNTKF